MTETVEKEARKKDNMRSLITTLGEASRGVAAIHMNSCVKCGLCGETCHIYRAQPVPENLPGAKASMVASHFKRYHTFTGKVVPLLIGAQKLDEKRVNLLKDAVFGRCTGCGRCGVNCSIGVDVGSVIRIGRTALASAGMVPANLEAVVKNQLEDGNQMSITPGELIDTADWIEEDLRLEMGDDRVELPVDKQGARVFYLINPREVKFFPLSLSAAAGIFHAAGESWTISSRFFDVTNYGLFTGDGKAAGEITRQAMDEARHLGCEEIVLSECGHGFRAFRWEGPGWLGSSYDRPVSSVLQVMEQYLDAGRIKLDRSKNSQRVTLHDPCNLVRWGGVSEPQRRLLKACVTDFVEMAPRREQNFCCGGGGGMLSMSEYGVRRVASGETKARQIRDTGARIVATPCHNCADQLLEINKKWSLGVEIQSVGELVYNALVLG